MKQIKLLVLLVLLVQSIITLAQTQDKPSSQDEETKAAMKEFKIVDAELKTVFNKILKMYKSDTEFIKNLKESQDIWMKFRVAELKTKFPRKSPGCLWKSLHHVC